MHGDTMLRISITKSLRVLEYITHKDGYKHVIIDVCTYKVFACKWGVNEHAGHLAVSDHRRPWRPATLRYSCRIVAGISMMKADSTILSDNRLTSKWC